MKDEVLTPQIRFPKFDKDWSKVTLGDLVKKHHIKNKEAIDYPIYSINNVSGFVPQGDQFEGLDSSKRGYDISMYKIIPQKCFAYNPARINVGSIGYSGDLKDIIISSLYVVFKTSDEVDDQFLLIYLKSKNFLKKVKRHVEGGVRDYLFFENFSSISTFFPSVEEQKKIAEVFNAIDIRLELLNSKLNDLKSFKQGALQRIFSKKIRFKKNDGSDFNNWKIMKVGDFLQESKIKGSNGLEAKKITVKLWGKGVIQKVEKSEGSTQTQYYKRKSGQFIYSKLDFLNCAFGIVPEELDGFESTVDLPSFNVSEELDSKFLLERVKMRNFYKKYGDTADGSRKAKRIHSETFLSFPIEFPEIAEQKKIAEFLSKIDSKILMTKEKIEETQKWKEGLLQKMFV